MCSLQLNDRVNHLMCLNRTLDHMTVAYSVCWYGQVVMEGGWSCLDHDNGV